MRSIGGKNDRKENRVDKGWWTIRLGEQVVNDVDYLSLPLGEGARFEYREAIPRLHASGFRPKADKGDPWALAAFGLCYLRGEGTAYSPDRALECFERALQAEPLNEGALVGKGMALCALGRYEESVKCFGRAPLPESIEALKWHGVALMETGEIEQALGSFDKALAIDAEYKDAMAEKAEALYRLGRYDEAMDWSSKAGLPPDDDLVQALLIQIITDKIRLDSPSIRRKMIKQLEELGPKCVAPRVKELHAQVLEFMERREGRPILQAFAAIAYRSNDALRALQRPTAFRPIASYALTVKRLDVSPEAARKGEGRGEGVVDPIIRMYAGKSEKLVGATPCFSEATSVVYEPAFGKQIYLPEGEDLVLKVLDSDTFSNDYLDHCVVPRENFRGKLEMVDGSEVDVNVEYSVR